MREPPVPIVLPGLHAYAEKSVEAGKSIHFRVSSDSAYTLGVYQLGATELSLDGPKDDVLQGTLIQGTAGQQNIAPGSYVNVDNGLPATQAPSALTLECWVRPIQFASSWQGLISQYTYPDACGFGMFLTGTGQVALYFGNGGPFDGTRLLTSSQTLSTWNWTHLVAVWDGAQVSLWINGTQAQLWSLSGPVLPGSAPLRLAAYGDTGQTSHFLNGDLCMPVIYGRALSSAEIQRRYSEQGLRTPAPSSVLACWPLNEEHGESVADIGPAGLTGSIINRATWMVGGASFNATAVPRFGEYDPTKDPMRGHGLRFAADDLYDCGWNVTHEVSLDTNLKPGIYVGRFEFGPDLQYTYDVTFVVKKARTRPKAKMVVLCATNTWLAYGATPFAANYTGTSPLQQWLLDGRHDNGSGTPAPSPGTAPIYNFYTAHLSGQLTYQLGVNMPWPIASPYAYYFGPIQYYSHLVRAERYTHVWLDTNGYSYDVISDFDLTQDPSSLDGYEVLLIAGHSEYWTRQAYQVVDRFLRLGHDVIVLSGNTMFWRVSFDESNSVMQCRKPANLPAGYAPVGETWHSDDGRRGGLMRDDGAPNWSVLGMESVGFWNAPPNMGQYTCCMPDHFLFRAPNPIHISANDPFCMGGIGHEWDVTVTLGQQGNVPFQPDPVNPGAIQTLGYSIAYNDTSNPAYSDTVWDFYGRNLQTLTSTTRNSEVIYWERSFGGRVFYAGSVATGRALWMDDERWGNLVRNVLAKFNVSASHSVT